MPSKIKIYKDNPTAGAQNGTLVSSGTGLAPIQTGNLKANTNEISAAIKLAVRCDAGHVTTGDVAVSIIDSGGVDKWSLAPDNAGAPGAFGAWGAGLSITGPVSDVNAIFWARARAVDTEEPVNDNSVQIRAEAEIAAA